MNQHEVIECLHRIDPVTADPPAPPIAPLLERLDLQRRSLEDPVTGDRGRRLPVRRSRLALAGVAAVGLAVGVFAIVGASGGGTQSVLADVYRAITPGSGVLHMLVVSENTAGAQTNTIREELWSAQNPRRLRTIITVGGESTESALTTSPLKVLHWSASSPDVIQQSVPSGVQSTEQDPVSWLREAYAKGELTVLGRTTIEGRELWQLSVHTTGPRPVLNGQPLPDPTVLVDASTFVPVENVIDSVTQAGGHPELAVTKVRYLTYQELPANSQNEAQLALAAHPGATQKTEEPSQG